MPKSLNQNMRDKILLLDKAEKQADVIAKNVGCSRSTIYRVLRDAKNINGGDSVGTAPIQFVSYRLPEGESVEVKVSGDNGVVATMVIDAIGMVFKRPKQKLASQHLSWEVLDRLSSLGLMMK